MQIVHKEDAGGAAIACLAMLTGKTYEEVKEYWEDRDFSADRYDGYNGLSLLECEVWLQDRGYHTRLFKPEDIDDGRYIGHIPYHFVAVENKIVYDPHQDAPVPLEEYRGAFLCLIRVSKQVVMKDKKGKK